MGYITTGMGYRGRELVQLHPRIPGHGPMYYGVRALPPEVLTTFTKYNP